MNNFMSKNRNFERYKRELEDVFRKTVTVFAKTIGNKSFRIGNPLNSSAFEATMIGLAERLKKGDVDLERFSKAYYELIGDQDFVEKTKGGTSDEKQLQERIQLAIDKFTTV
jgi:hypothetical protein